MNNKIIQLLVIGILALPAYSYALTVKSVDFMNVKNKSRIQIGLDGKATYDVSKKGDVVVLKIDGAKIPDNLSRPFLTFDFVTPVDKFIPKQEGKNVVFEITMKKMSPYFITQDKNQILMDFDIPADMKQAQTVSRDDVPKVVSAPSKKKVSGEKDLAVSKADVGEVSTQIKQTTVLDTSKQKYKGQTVTLDFQNADIQNVLRIIADVSGLNIVTSDEVKGQITIRLKDVPWDQALDVVLESKDLSKMELGNVVRIAPADKIKAAQDRIIASQKTEEQLEPLYTIVIPVNFSKATEMINLLKGKEIGIMTDRGSIVADSRTNVLIIKDTKKSVDAISTMIKRLDKPTPQVLIAARVVQADDSYSKSLGVAWGGMYRSQSGKSFFGLTGNQSQLSAQPTSLFDSVTTPGGNPNWSSTTLPTPAYAVNFPSQAASGIGIQLGRLAGSAFDLDLRLTIGEGTGTIKVLARPKVVTLDNKKATIKQGEKYPYVVRNQEGQLSTELKDIDLVLEVTPRIAFDGSINMEIVVKRNSLGAERNALGDPSIASREVQTEIMVKDGETAVIGGIIEEETHLTISQIPVLGDIPVIGWLFKSKETVKTKKELLIFITPQVLEDIAYSK
jgi:type IV pilus assembly protein PilQ